MLGDLPQRLARLAGALTGKRFAFGSGNAGWGGTGTLSPTVAHGLAKIPAFAIGVLLGGGSIFFNVHYVGVQSMDDTNFVPVWQLDTGTSAGNSNYMWMAVA